MKWWKYLYYKTYKISINFNTIDPELGTTLFMTVIFSLSLVSMKRIISVIVQNPIFVENEINGLIVFGVAFFIQWFLFLRNNKYKEILNEFNGDIKNESISDYVIVLVIFVLTASVWFYTGSLYKEVFLLQK